MKYHVKYGAVQLPIKLVRETQSQIIFEYEDFVLANQQLKLSIGEKAIEPKDKEVKERLDNIFFYPNAQNIFIQETCPQALQPIEITFGVVIKGEFEPVVDEVEISILKDDRLFQVQTISTKYFVMGPYPPSHEYTLRIEKNNHQCTQKA